MGPSKALRALSAPTILTLYAIMKKTLISFLLLTTASICFASKLAPFDYSRLSQAPIIVIGKVVGNSMNMPEGACSSWKYRSTVMVVTVLKGVVKEKEFTLPVCIGKKGFNIQLHKNLHYIFFLDRKNGEFLRISPKGAVAQFG